MSLDYKKQISVNHYLCLLIFLTTFLGLVLVESLLQPHAIAGLYMHGIPSETMMQTVSLIDLKADGFSTLWNLHVQPPLFDFLRMILVKLSGHNDSLEMQYFVDRSLYLLWALIYGLSCMLVFNWISKLTNAWYAILATVIFAANPATLLYSTLLETTFLSSFLILWFVYLLWKIKNSEYVSPSLLAASFLLLFFTRSIFQWQWIFFLAACLMILKYPKMSLRKFFIITSCVVFAYMGKQYTLFDITTTSSLTGINLCQSIQACKPHKVSDIATEQLQASPDVLTRKQKLTGAHNFNNLIDLELNNIYIQDYKDKLIELDASQILSIYYQNALIYFQPSSNYASTNLLLTKLPPRWMNYYEKFFSAPILPSLLLILSLFWIAKSSAAEFYKSAGLFLPILAIMLISIVFESGENMRFKFFIEPILWIFISTQVYLMLVSIKKSIGHIQK